MNLSHFFVDRPIFATVLSLFVIIAARRPISHCRSLNTRR